MTKLASSLGAAMFAAVLASSAAAQVYSPVVLREGAIDTTDMHRMAEGIVRNAHAETPRQKAEAVWRYFLTDGRFVKPGIFYHIPGWSYEEPMGEVLDPVKLVNSYGFGLCYQDAPLLQATWEALGMPARVWFLTGHTVAEVFYEGAYHYYDSDMMGYTTTGDGPVWSSPVASVQQLAHDPSIITGKLLSAKMTRAGSVDAPWYPADLRAEAIKDLADLFSTSEDNYLYTGKRYPSGHTMDFTLRPGERMIRFYDAGATAERYMPYHDREGKWQESPKDYSSILQVKNGPVSEKDERRWSTGVLEYKPTAGAQAAAQKNHDGVAEWVYQVASPYVLVDAEFRATLSNSSSSGLHAETSIDDGHTWVTAARTSSTGQSWTARAADLVTTEHGTHRAVAGSYGYLLRLRSDDASAVPHDLVIRSTFEFNPRTLPELLPGVNNYQVSESKLSRQELPIRASSALQFAASAQHVVYNDDQGQGYLRNEDGSEGELIFTLDRSADGQLQEVSAGGRFLNLSGGLAPDKLTAETRHVTPWPADPSASRTASIAWSPTKNGPWTTLWSLAPNASDVPDVPLSHQLQWPEVDRVVRNLPAGNGPVFVRYRFHNIAVDDIRLATMRQPRSVATRLQVTLCWMLDGKAQSSSHVVSSLQDTYSISIPQDRPVRPVALLLSAQSDGTSQDTCPANPAR